MVEVSHGSLHESLAAGRLRLRGTPMCVTAAPRRGRSLLRSTVAVVLAHTASAFAVAHPTHEGRPTVLGPHKERNMAEAAELLPPIEIPWQLAATTQPLSANEPEETALSLFFFEPDDATLTSKFPDDRIVFVKYTASISPAKFPAELSKVAASFLGEGIPCYHVLLDLKVRNAADEIGTIRPYFHTAAPLARRMVQTGVVGVDAYEGEADALAIGKSGSQMNESLRSHSNTLTASASAGFSIGPFGASGSIRNTTTDVASNRAVSQVVDTTNREASEERRELVSHTTRVENIISLLSAKYIGTPHLSFSVSAEPL